MTRYHAEVIAVVGVDVDADTVQEAETRAKHTVYARPWLPPGSVIRVSAEPFTSIDNLAHANIRVYQETEALRLGTVSQRERWAQQCLPDEELLKIVRDELFMPYALFRRRRQLGASAIEHPTDERGTWLCTPIDGHVPIEWSTTPSVPPIPLTAGEWDTLRRLRDATEECARHRWLAVRANTTLVRLSIREHRGTCSSCRRSASERSALVQIEWAERTLSREYLL